MIKVVELLPGKFVLPIFKNGLSSIEAYAKEKNIKWLINEQLKNIDTITIFLREPAERFVSGVHSFIEFEKRKNKGRIDVYGNWEKIKESWITAYLNKENIPGLSVNVVVDANDEWCAEAYMETDYQTLSEKDFEKSVKDFVAFLVSNDKC